MARSVAARWRRRCVAAARGRAAREGGGGAAALARAAAHASPSCVACRRPVADRRRVPRRPARGARAAPGPARRWRRRRRSRTLQAEKAAACSASCCAPRGPTAGPASCPSPSAARCLRRWRCARSSCARRRRRTRRRRERDGANFARAPARRAGVAHPSGVRQHGRNKTGATPARCSSCIGRRGAGCGYRIRCSRRAGIAPSSNSSTEALWARPSRSTSHVPPRTPWKPTLAAALAALDGPADSSGSASAAVARCATAGATPASSTARRRVASAQESRQRRARRIGASDILRQGEAVDAARYAASPAAASRRRRRRAAVRPRHPRRRDRKRNTARATRTAWARRRERFRAAAYCSVCGWRSAAAALVWGGSARCGRRNPDGRRSSTEAALQLRRLHRRAGGGGVVPRQALQSEATRARVAPRAPRRGDGRRRLGARSLTDAAHRAARGRSGRGGVPRRGLGPARGAHTPEERVHRLHRIARRNRSRSRRASHARSTPRSSSPRDAASALASNWLPSAAARARRCSRRRVAGCARAHGGASLVESEDDRYAGGAGATRRARREALNALAQRGPARGASVGAAALIGGRRGGGAGLELDGAEPPARRGGRHRGTRPRRRAVAKRGAAPLASRPRPASVPTAPGARWTPSGGAGSCGLRARGRQRHLGVELRDGQHVHLPRSAAAPRRSNSTTTRRADHAARRQPGRRRRGSAAARRARAALSRVPLCDAERYRAHRRDSPPRSSTLWRWPSGGARRRHCAAAPVCSRCWPRAPATRALALEMTAEIAALAPESRRGARPRRPRQSRRRCTRRRWTSTPTLGGGGGGGLRRGRSSKCSAKDEASL